MRYEFPPRPPQGWTELADTPATWIEHEYCLIGTPSSGAQSKLLAPDSDGASKVSALVTERTYGDYGLVAKVLDNGNYVLGRVATWFRDAIIYEKVNNQYRELARAPLTDSFMLPAVHTLAVVGGVATFTVEQPLDRAPIVVTANVKAGTAGKAGVRVNAGSVWYYSVDIT